MEELYNKSNPDMTEVCPPVPPSTREASTAEPGAGSWGGVRKATLRHHRSPPVWPILVASTAAVAAAATIAVPAVTVATATTAGTFPCLWEDLRGTWRFSSSSSYYKADARGPSHGA